MFLLVPAHPGCPGQNQESRNTVVVVVVVILLCLMHMKLFHFSSKVHIEDKMIKLEKQGWVFYGSCMVRKALGLMEIGPP